MFIVLDCRTYKLLYLWRCSLFQSCLVYSHILLVSPHFLLLSQKKNWEINGESTPSRVQWFSPFFDPTKGVFLRVPIWCFTRISVIPTKVFNWCKGSSVLLYEVFISFQVVSEFIQEKEVDKITHVQKYFNFLTYWGVIKYYGKPLPLDCEKNIHGNHDMMY